MALARPWTAWGDWKDEVKRLKRAAELVLKRWRGSHISPAFAEWKRSYEDARSTCFKETMILVRWTKTSLVIAFARWVEQATETQRLHRVADTIVGRMANMVIAPVLYLWRQTCFMQHDKRGPVFTWLDFMDRITVATAHQHFELWALNSKD